MSKDDELVLCIHRPLLEERFGVWSGFRSYEKAAAVTPDKPADTFYDKLLADSKFVRRGDCENDPSLKQIIPYIVLCCGGPFGEQLFCYTRSKTGGEGRLFGKKSLGLGGHVNPQDGRSPKSCFIRACYRELAEEVTIQSEHQDGFTALGLVNHDEDDVGKVHVGVVLLVNVETPAVYPAEDAIYGGHFAHLRELVQYVGTERHEQFERWSQLLLEAKDFRDVFEPAYPDVIVEVSGGNVQAAYSYLPIDLSVLDWDNRKECDVDDEDDSEEAAWLRKDRDRYDKLQEFIEAGMPAIY